MSTDTTLASDVWFAAQEASENAGPFTALRPPSVDDEAKALRAGVTAGSVQYASQRAEIDDLRARLAAAVIENRRLVARGFKERARAWDESGDLLIASAYGQSADTIDFARRGANEMRAHARLAEAAATVVDPTGTDGDSNA